MDISFFLVPYVGISEKNIGVYPAVWYYDLKACFNPWKWDRYYSSKKRLDVSSYHQAVAWVDYCNFNVLSLHTWTICSKKDDMAFLFFHQPSYMDLIITKTM